MTLVAQMFSHLDLEAGLEHVAHRARSQLDGTALPHPKTAEGMTRREARRAHKRHLANRVIRRMWRDEQHRLKTQLQAA
ncbi:hypothetical protein [Candidatus Poriferisodalis sp.]|uniref:hypothetical protein n=1 Tax=Candidatus Poriferisodalis sp. TaxID=3101277 RepID=UPI003B025A1D